jgi:hypothetical protein
MPNEQRDLWPPSIRLNNGRGCYVICAYVNVGLRWRLEHSSIECLYHNDVRARALAGARQWVALSTLDQKIRHQFRTFAVKMLPKN